MVLINFFQKISNFYGPEWIGNFRYWTGLDQNILVMAAQTAPSWQLTAMPSWQLSQRRRDSSDNALVAAQPAPVWQLSQRSRCSSAIASYNLHEKNIKCSIYQRFSLFFDIGTSIFEISVKKDSDSWGQIKISSFLRHFVIFSYILKLLTIRIDSGMKFCV